ncbi:MAG: MBL fold metallo-hydrolase [Chloroflexota bacterium]
MQVWSLSSGSSGNCYLIKERDSLILVEAGLGVRRVIQELQQLGLGGSHVDGIVVSHEHSDHVSSATALAKRFRSPLICTGGTWRSLASKAHAVEWTCITRGRPVQVGSLLIEGFPIPHDANEPVGFSIQSDSAKVCLATDMGFATEEAVERASNADLVILEANHDLDMLKQGPYPAHLKARILGDRGHLSNIDAAKTILKTVRGRPRLYWLAHLSNTNNSPGVAFKTVKEFLRREGLDHLMVEVALRNRRSLFWDSKVAPAQLPLFG